MPLKERPAEARQVMLQGHMGVALYGVSKKVGEQDAENQMAQLRTFAAMQGWGRSSTSTPIS
jgi:hypothetical protein